MKGNGMNERKMLKISLYSIDNEKVKSILIDCPEEVWNHSIGSAWIYALNTIKDLMNDHCTEELALPRVEKILVKNYS